MDAHGTGQLCDTRNRHLYLLAGRHDEVAKLVDDNHDIGHVFMTIGQAQLVVDILAVVFFDVFRSRHLEQVVTGVHQFAQAVQGIDHLLHVGDDRFIRVWHLRHEMVGNGTVDAELHLLGVAEHEFQFIGMLLVEQ